MSLIIGARRHLEWGHDKYIMEMIHSHPTQVIKHSSYVCLFSCCHPLCSYVPCTKFDFMVFCLSYCRLFLVEWLEICQRSMLFLGFVITSYFKIPYYPLMFAPYQLISFFFQIRLRDYGVLDFDAGDARRQPLVDTTWKQLTPNQQHHEL